MPNKHLCPFCGELTERPVIGSYTRQRIFNYIWDNPECGQEEIEFSIWGKRVRSNVLSAHLHQIRRALIKHRYMLQATRAGGRLNYYKIIRRPKTCTTERHDNVPA